MAPAEKYAAAYAELGSNRAVAARFGVNESTVRRVLRAKRARDGADPAVREGMDGVGLEHLPSGGWIKTHTPDEHGRTYSFYVRPQADQEEAETRLDRIEEMFRSIPAVRLPGPPPRGGRLDLVGLLPLNDLHAGAYAWKPETGYGDWDLDKAIERLQTWVGALIDRMPVVDECILFYNGDTLHMNDGRAMTPASGNILDWDSRQPKVIDETTAAIIATADMALQKHRTVRIVIKRGNHDPESYLGLLMGCKWRYAQEERVFVETDPSPYWAYRFGKVFLFGHHGDRVKPENLVMKMAADHPDTWGETRYRYVWTAHLHSRQVVQHFGTVVERASCITEPDAHGAGWGNNAMAQAIIYDPRRGEIERHTVRA